MATGKAINEIPAKSDMQMSDDSLLVFVGAATNGQLYSGTVAQQKKVFRTQKVLYKATGTEGSNIAPAVIAGANVLAIFREGTIIYEASATPDGGEYTFDSTTIHFGSPINTGERILILYQVG